MAGQDQQYKIIDAFITANRFQDKEIEVSSNLYELILYEDLEVAWLTGSVAITDDTGFLNKLEFKGSELLTLRIAGAVENSSPVIDKTFVMYALEKNVRVNDVASVYLFSIIEQHAYINSFKPFSRAYSGPLEKIIQQIVNGELNKTIDLSYLTKSVTAQGERKYIVPYLTPLEACETLLDRATSDLGSPLFLYSSIHDENTRLGDLDRMLTQDAFNKKVPYIYSQSATQSASSLDPASASTQVSSFDVKKSVDTLLQTEEGLYGSFYTNTDVSTGISYRTRVTLEDTLLGLKQNEIIDPESKQDLYDDLQTIEEKAIKEFDSIYWHQLSSSNLYPDFRSYHDDNTTSGFALKIKSNLIRQSLLANMVTIVVPGIAFLMSKATVGDILSLNILSPQQNPNEIYDKRWSGDYVVYRTKHVFRETKHTVTCDITRLSRRSNRESPA